MEKNPMRKKLQLLFLLIICLLNSTNAEIHIPFNTGLALRYVSERDYNKIIQSGYSLKDYNVFVKLISNASEIITDRLYVGILGAMLGKKVYLYKTKYDKVPL